MFGWIKKLFRKQDPEIVALVILEESPRLIEVERVRAAFRVAGMSVEPVEERPNYIRVRMAGWNFVVLSYPIPYEALLGARIKDNRMQSLVERHQAFFCVECFEAPPGVDRASAARPVLAKVTNAFLDETSLALYEWPTGRYVPVSPEVRESLEAGDMQGVVDSYRALIVSVEDDAIEDAIEEARQRWPEFVAHFQTLDDPSNALVKCRFEWQDSAEHMWMEPIEVTPAGVRGTLLNEPLNIWNVKCGEVVWKDLDDVSDWGVVINDQPIGMFTNRIVHGSAERED